MPRTPVTGIKGAYTAFKTRDDVRDEKLRELTAAEAGGDTREIANARRRFNAADKKRQRAIDGVDRQLSDLEREHFSPSSE